MSQQRHLAAILFTDIVGYTALMQENEQKAVALINNYNASLNRIVPLHDGRVEGFELLRGWKPLHIFQRYSAR